MLIYIWVIRLLDGKTGVGLKAQLSLRLIYLNSPTSTCNPRKIIYVTDNRQARNVLLLDSSYIRRRFRYFLG